MQLTISKKLFINNLLAIVGLVSILLVTAVYSPRVTHLAQTSKDDATKYALMAREAQLYAVQVQQWLQDISATRAQEGFADGFDMAEENAKQFRDVMAEFRQYYTTQGDVQRQESAKELAEAFESFYVTGKTMAQAYIDGGPSAGNAMMDEFDLVAERIYGSLDQLVTYHQEQLDTIVGDLVNAAKASNWAIITCVSVLTVALLCVGWLVTRSIVGPFNKQLRPWKTSRKEMEI